MLYFVLLGKKNKNLPPPAILAVNAFMFLPMFVDLLTIWTKSRAPSNDVRYLTGILFGEAFIALLYPAFVSLVCSDARDRATMNSLARYGIYVLSGVAAFFLKEIHSLIALVALSGLSFIGFGSLVAIFLVGTVRGIGLLWEKMRAVT